MFHEAVWTLRRYSPLPALLRRVRNLSRGIVRNKNSTYNAIHIGVSRTSRPLRCVSTVPPTSLIAEICVSLRIRAASPYLYIPFKRDAWNTVHFASRNSEEAIAYYRSVNTKYAHSFFFYLFWEIFFTLVLTNFRNNLLNYLFTIELWNRDDWLHETQHAHK
jgi:hypothetical protein